MTYEFKRISHQNGALATLWRDWDNSCSAFGEDFSEYSISSMETLRSLAEEPQVPTRGVFGVYDGESILAICQLNVARLPGYDGKVLRVRHITLAPEFDYSDEKSIDDYADALSEILVGTIELSNVEMEAPYIKFHLRSPNDKSFFTDFSDNLARRSLLANVAIKGSWLYITKD